MTSNLTALWSEKMLRMISIFLNLPRLDLWLWGRQWHPIPVLLPGKSHGQRGLVGCSHLKIDSHHGGTWDSPVGKPRGKDSGKASRESRRSLVRLEGKLDTAATARVENPRAYLHSRRGMTPLGDTRRTQDPYQHWRGILMFRHRLHTIS